MAYSHNDWVRPRRGARVANRTAKGDRPTLLRAAIPPLVHETSTASARDVDPVPRQDHLDILARNDVRLPREPFAAELPIEGIHPPVAAVFVEPMRAVGVAPTPVGVVPVTPVAVMIAPMGLQGFLLGCVHRRIGADENGCARQHSHDQRGTHPHFRLPRASPPSGSPSYLGVSNIRELKSKWCSTRERFAVAWDTNPKRERGFSAHLAHASGW